MLAPDTIQLITKRLSSKPISFQPTGGGSINDCYRINFQNKTLFCKAASASAFPGLFQKEKAGIELIIKQGVIKTPAVIDCFEQDDTQILLLEWIEAGERTEAFWKSFGEQLAMLHQIKNEKFGLNNDNYMGSVPQSNVYHQTWANFFTAERLQPMMRRCFDKNLLAKKHLDQAQNLEQKLREIFEDEPPSFLHGDLWSVHYVSFVTLSPAY